MNSQTAAAGMERGLRVAAAPADPGREALLEAARGTAEEVEIVGTGSIGQPTLEPLVLATVDGRTALLPTPGEEAVRAAVDRLAGGDLPESASYVIEHETETKTLPVPDDGPLAVGQRRVTASCGWLNPLASEDWDLCSASADASEIANLGIRARGRGDAVADDSAATAWEQARESDGDPLVVVNAHESDQRSRADRLLLESSPIAVLDGAAAVAGAVGAERVICYLNEADDDLREHLRAVVDAATDLPVDTEIATGPDRYLAGEPTVALEAMEEADRLEPRLQPPGPATHGLYGRPTVLHTPRTFGQIRAALATPEVFDTGADDPGTRLVSVTGDVEEPAVVELPTDGSLAATREAVSVDGRFKMACVGGALGGLTRDLSVPPSAPALRSASLGTNGVVELFSDRRCPLAVAGERVQFAAEENSGRCVPGREGTVQLTGLLRDIYDGTIETEKLRELGRVMERSANCQIGAQAPRPALTAVEEFSSEIRAHADGRCPSGACEVTTSGFHGESV
ncbi:NADH-ubiquinone oxidoreductase-F iron-sulfur binding region domain-containing protein [Halovenus sp. HT40]|uniref:NADH-ubiquinone oxidoreductase-F iron-sulfur binding region domain-containing protein n=1 Tax=Halovenus sp. HT40 TaxID=3126691 RepID=UPI00300F3D63